MKKNTFRGDLTDISAEKIPMNLVLVDRGNLKGWMDLENHCVWRRISDFVIAK